MTRKDNFMGQAGAKPMQDQELWHQAVLARENAYAPYSKFKVGAALRCQDNTIITGANVENASYPLGCCAERTAVYTAVSRGHRTFLRIVVVGPGPELIFPCGGCRQVLAEFGDFEVVLADISGRVESRILSVSQLLPHQFGREDLHGL